MCGGTPRHTTIQHLPHCLNSVVIVNMLILQTEHHSIGWQRTLIGQTNCHVI